MRKEIAWISPLRTGIIYAAVVSVVYVVFSIVMLIFGSMGNMGSGIEGAGMMIGGGFLSIILGLVMGALSGFIGGMLGAFVYNIAASTVGGVVIELKDP